MPNKLGNEVRLTYRIALGQPPHSTLPNHGHRFDPLQRSPGTLKGAITLGQPDPLLHFSMVLFHYIIEVLALAQANTATECAFPFQTLHCDRIGGVLVDVHDAWDGIA